MKKPERVMRILFPVNSLFFFNSMPKWESVNIMKMEAMGQIETGKGKTWEETDSIQVMEYTGRKLIIDFKADGLNDSKKPSEIYQKCNELELPDVKISSLVCRHVIDEDSMKFMDLTFKPKTLHKGILKDLVVNGKLPNQDIGKFVKKIKESIKMKFPKEKRQNITDMLKTYKGTTLVLDKVTPSEYWKDEPLINSFRREHMPMGLFYDKTTKWELEEIGHKKKGGVKK